MDTPGHHYDQQDYYRNLHGISGEGHVSMDESIDHSDYAAELDVKMVLYTDRCQLEQCWHCELRLAISSRR